MTSKKGSGFRVQEKRPAGGGAQVRQRPPLHFGMKKYLSSESSIPEPRPLNPEP
ncbi:MAG: hypothetical protein ACKVS9_01160 [Phycisphaerae bacterium]